jgi:serralysin
MLGAETTGVDTLTDSSGTDTVFSTITRSLGTWVNIENLLLQGAGNINGTGNNGILGNAGNNILAGLTGNDALNGGAGNDSPFGQTGQDNLTGGLGNDTLVYQTQSDSPTGALCDFAYDFDDANNDRVDLNAVHGPALAYIGTAAFTAIGKGADQRYAGGTSRCRGQPHRQHHQRRDADPHAQYHSRPDGIDDFVLA